MNDWRSFPVTELSGEAVPSALRHGKYGVDRAWLRGDRSLLGLDALAIVGSREATDEAKWFAGRLATRAVARGLMVVSGGARGVDLAAHLAALASGGRTLVVLGTPIGQPYPASHEAVLQRVLNQHGAWLSEVPSEAGYSPRYFVERNRLIVALSLAVVVVSARVRSGALTTAQWAHKWPKPLAVVTGSPWDEHVGGSRQWLGRATAIASEDDFSAWLDRLGVPAATPRQPLATAATTGSLHEWAQRLRMPELAVAAWLARGEIEGWALGLGSGRYLVADPRAGDVSGFRS